MGGLCSTGFSTQKFVSKNSRSNHYHYHHHHHVDLISKTPTPMHYHFGELGIPSARFATRSPQSQYKVPQMLGRASIIGLERAVEVFDMLGSSMSNLNPNSHGFISGITSRGDKKISILAFI